MAATHTHVLVLDFDGTVCLGDGPVFAYARLLDEALGVLGYLLVEFCLCHLGSLVGGGLSPLLV